MTKNLWCAPAVYMAKIDHDILVLDLNADRYFCLLDAAEAVDPQGDGFLVLADIATADDLLAAELATRDQPQHKRLAIIAPRRELALSPNPPKMEIFRAGVAWVVAALLFRGKPLSALVDYHAARPIRLLKPDEAWLSELVGAARLARPWIPFEGECLQRSFQLRCLLAARGVASDWIFGVRTWPFSAHCWLQVGDLVVGDRLERVRRYTPIMRT